MLCHFPPQPNHIMLGDFNLPEINSSNLNPICPTASSLLNLTSLTCQNQQVSEPMRNCYILDLILSHSLLLSQTFFSLIIV